SSSVINVNAAGLSTASRVTMAGATGPRAGPAFENDPNGVVDWTTVSTAPAAAVTLFTTEVATKSVSTSRPIEVGVKFRSDSDGTVLGVRFYKLSSANSGTHIGSLWSAAGQLLASATFTGETSSGWQTVAFAAPVAINANTTYIASYHTTTEYSVSRNYFTNAGVDD